MTISEKYILGIDFSKQPDNELWYVTVDGQKAKSVLPTYGGQTMTVLSHTYENGIGKITYKETLINIGERILQDDNIILASMPKKIKKIGNYCCNCSILILLSEQRIDLGSIYFFQRSGTLFVLPGCAKYFNKNNIKQTNLIEKKLRDIEYITFENPKVEHTCLIHFDTNKDGKISIDEAESVTSINRFFNNTDIENLNDFQHFKNVTNISNAFFGCSKIKVANIWEGVQELGDNLLMGANNVEKVIIPSTIRDMGQMWIRSRLIGKAVVIIKSETPPKINNYNFTSVAKTLYVPDSAVDRYKADTKMIKYLTDNIKPISEYKDDK